jgi:hypothetical protein
VDSLSQRRIKRDDSSPAFDLEETGFVINPAKVEIGSGYAVTVAYDENDDAIVDVKTYGNVDMAKVHMELETLFPKARIRHLVPTSSVALIRKTKKKRR